MYYFRLFFKQTAHISFECLLCAFAEAYVLLPLFFVANLGGTLGVCFGGSILTLLELFEFLILKLATEIRKKNQIGSRRTQEKQIHQ